MLVKVVLAHTLEFSSPRVELYSLLYAELLHHVQRKGIIVTLLL